LVGFGICNPIPHFFLKKATLSIFFGKGNLVYRGSCVLRSYGQQYLIQEKVFGIVIFGIEEWKWLRLY
jgi:hypothetical protein